MLPDVTERHEHVESDWLPPRVIAKSLGVSSRTVSRMADRGDLESMRLPSGHRRLRRVAITPVD